MSRTQVLVFLILFLSACSNSVVSKSAVPAGPSASQIRVVATTTIIADMVRQVGGDRVQVASLLPVGADPHTFNPVPSDVRMVAEANIVFQNGAGFDDWLGSIIANAGGQRPVVVVSKGLEPSREADDGRQVDDPHFWFDVRYAAVYVQNIRDGLIAADPAGAEAYRRHAERYLTELRSLDEWIQQQVALLPPERRVLVTSHETFGYFAQRYGFRIVGAVIPSASAGAEPSAQQIAALIQAIKAAGAPAIFTETTINPALADRVAREAGVKVVKQLYTDSLGPPGSGADTYIGMMRFDAETIVTALKGS